MSYRAETWAWEQPLKGSKKLLLLALADQANDELECWPSVAKLVTRVGVSRARVFEMLAELETNGLIEREERQRKDGGRSSNLYHLKADDPRPVEATPPSSPPDGGPSSGSDGINRKEEPSASNEASADPIEQDTQLAWSIWLELRQPPRARALSDGTRKQLRRALKAGYGIEELRAMMGALLASDWHAERRLLTLSSILATKPGGPTFEDQLDTWLERAGLQAHGGKANTSEYNARLSRVKRDVLDAWRTPGNESVVRQGEEAAAWLAQHGWVVEYEEDGRPRFREGGAS